MVLFSPSHKILSNRLLSVLLLLVSCIIISCSTPPPAADQKNIIIVQFGESRAPLVNGFIDKMTEYGYQQGKTVNYTFLDANQSKQQLNTLLEQLDTSNVDLIAAAGGVEADAIKNRLATENGPPVVVLCISSLLERKLIESRMHPGWQVTGVDSLNKELVAKRISLISELLPATKQILILHSSRKKSPSYQGMLVAKKTAEPLNMEIISRATDSDAEIQDIFESESINNIDFLLLMPAAKIVDTFFSTILPQTKKHKIDR